MVVCVDVWNVFMVCVLVAMLWCVFVFGGVDIGVVLMMIWYDG